MPEAGRGINGTALASAVFNHTLNLGNQNNVLLLKKIEELTHVLPHQLRLTPPLFHTCSVKNIAIADSATPPSSAADKI